MTKRSHKQNCALAHAADLICERWTLLIVRELLLKPRKYNELLAHLPTMGTNLLAKRLKEMQSLQLISKDESRQYQLNELGKTLEPSVLSLIRWGFQVAGDRHRVDYFHVNEWDLLAMKALFNPANKQTQPITMQWGLHDVSAWVSVQTESFTFGWGKAKRANFVWRLPLKKLSDPQAQKCLTTEQEQAALKAFLGCFIS